VTLIIRSGGGGETAVIPDVGLCQGSAGEQGHLEFYSIR
jgi:hypothetical protein